MRKNVLFAYANCRVAELTEELNLKQLKRRNLIEEFDELMAIVDRLGCPTVFCHVDFRGSNLLVTEIEEEKRILLVDPEYCEYGCRGFDLATIIYEWGKEQFDILSTLNPPDEQEMCQLVQQYIDAVDQLIPGYSKKVQNSLAAHLKEVKIMFLVNAMFFITLMIRQRDTIITAIPFDAKKNMVMIKERKI